MRISYHNTIAVFLRRTRFTAYAVARNIRIFSASAGNHRLQYFSYRRARLFRYYPAHGYGFISCNYIAVIVRQRLNKMRLHQISTVYSRTKRAHKLKRRNRNRLTEGYARKIHITHIFLRQYQPALIGRKINSRFASEPECPNILIQLIRSQRQPHLHKCSVAGILNSLGQVLRAMRNTSPAFYLLSVHKLISGIVKCSVFIYLSLLKRRRKSYHLEGRARLINIQYRPVPRKLRSCLPVTALRLVQVIVRHIHHCKYTARRRLHNYAYGVFGVLLRHALTHGAFRKFLNIVINRQRKIQPV